jgi:hypothetical protein
MVRRIWVEMAVARLPDQEEILSEFRRHRESIAGNLNESDIAEDVRQGWEQTQAAYRRGHERAFGVMIEART